MNDRLLKKLILETIQEVLHEDDVADAPIKHKMTYSRKDFENETDPAKSKIMHSIFRKDHHIQSLINSIEMAKEMFDESNDENRKKEYKEMIRDIKDQIQEAKIEVIELKRALERLYTPDED